MIIEENLAEIAITLDKCVVVESNKAIVPVKVISLEEGTLPTNIEKNVLGKVLNSKDLEVSITNLESKYVNKISIDTLRTEDNLSNIYYSMDSNDGHAKLKEFDELMSFELVYKFDEVPSSINVLGNNIYINNTSVCEKINGYKTEYIDNSSSIEDGITNYIPIVVCIILAIIAASEFITIKVKNKKTS